MKRQLTLTALLFAALTLVASAQSPQRLVPYSGSVAVPDGQSAPRSATVTFSLYEAQTGGAPLWTEVQVLEVDSAGRYSVVLGSATGEGLPADLFGSGTPRWFGAQVDGGAEQPRMQLLAVPYAVAAGSAASLGGRAADDFVLTENLPKSVRDQVKQRAEGGADFEDRPITNATADRLVKYQDAGGTLADSALTELGGNLGIGTAAPNYGLQVNSGGNSLIQFTNPTTGTGPADGSYFGILAGQNLFRVYNFEAGDIGFFTGNLRRLTIGAGGNIGVGTTAPNYPLQVNSAGNHSLLQFTNATTGTGATDGSYFGLLDGSASFRIYNFENSDMAFFTNNAKRMTVAANGNIGIGTASPSTLLHVAGNTQIDGNAVVNGNIGAKYQDVAEWVPVTDAIEAGTIVVVDRDLEHHVRASDSAYQTTVAGAVSAQPGLILGEAGPNKVMVAQSGRVRVKVDASFGAIKAGDLLVTSPTAGHAMRSQPAKIGGIMIHRPGTIVGKALEPLDRGKGEILALLTLQ